MRICIYGAGGPVAASAVEALAGGHELRLTDVKDLETPHEFQRVDVAIEDQVVAAAEGMDALINCTVIREDPALAFAVNLGGAYNVMRAALRWGIPRVVQTGPASMFASRGGYMLDHDVTEEAPARPGMNLYGMSKFLGHEVVRTFCHRHPELSAIEFVYSGFYSQPLEGRGWLPHFAVDARDAGQAFRLGVEIPRERLPHNYELFFVSAEMPNRHISVEKARRILRYEPAHNFDHIWSRRARAAFEAEQNAAGEG